MNWRDLLFILMFFMVLSASYNAREAHTHSHEAACAAGHNPACKWVHP